MAGMSERRQSGGSRSGWWRIALSAAALFTLCGCKVDLYTKLQEREANLIAATLLRNQMTADRIEMKDGTSTVRVEQEQFADAVALLNAAGLPRAKFQTMGEIFSSEGLVSSPTEERARFIFALSQELARTVSEIDGVVSARVHVVLPKNDPLRQDQTPSSASVFIKHDLGTQVTTLLPQIKSLIANSVEGLTYDKVSVVFVPSDPEAMSAGPRVSTIPAIHADGAAAAPLRRMDYGLAGVGVAVLLAAMLLWMWRRARGDARLRPQQAENDARGREPLRVAS
jgi:type III secretion protein J